MRAQFPMYPCLLVEKWVLFGCRFGSSLVVALLFALVVALVVRQKKERV